MTQTEIFEANLDLTLHSQAVLELLNAYAADPMGVGKPLTQDVLKELIPGLQHHPTTIIFIAFHDNKAAGIVTCFKGFSTFQARPMINISDFYLHPDYRGLKIGQRLLAIVEKKAIELSCCKITLEIQENNIRAMQIYKAAGFNQDVHVKEVGRAVLFSKPLSK
ncbi:MAG: GNAT family N-acetyltransferase [Desulfobacula sp.]|uniref:GNAT family N-acetyltransferase n=1 Tax=Desulfobacula sp. TaxID=2593537 RepID=UPI0025C68A8A|nr:GNAT family N-acetyltransferase [Desulfobacula sp.]MCD4721249.1 GNAT family N-acetyltransferase [Desulfobacula sp.]